MAKRLRLNGSRLVNIYDYLDESGVLVRQVLRFEPKGFSQRRPDGHGGWINNVRGVPRVLYRLSDVRRAMAERPPGQRVV